MDDTVADGGRQTQQATAAAVSVAANAKTTNVKLLIKASNQQFEDQIIESDMLWTVKRLKVQLSLVYPSKPPVAEQKLIYSGQLLNDKLLLKDVLRSYKDVYTQNHIMHLVFTPKNTATQSAKVDTRKSNNNPRATIMQNNLNASGTSSSSTLRQRLVQSQPATELPTQQQQQQQLLEQQQQQYAQFANQYMSQMGNAAPGGMPCPPYAPQFMPFNMQLMATQQNAMQLWMQQVYTQYMDQCARLFSANGMPGGSGTPTNAPGLANWPINPFFPPNAAYPVMMPPTFQPAPTSVPQPNQAAAAAAAVPPAAAEQPRQQGAAEPRFPLIVQEEVDNRDWLDSFFSITRLAIFLTILYFNSSPLRCLIVLVIGSFIYLYHIGVLRFNRERNNNNINRNNNDNAPAQIPQGAAAAAVAGNAEPDEENEDESTSEEEDELQQQARRATAAAATTANNSAAAAANSNEGGADLEESTHSMLCTLRTFVITFFTSLLPETPAI